MSPDRTASRARALVLGIGLVCTVAEARAANWDWQPRLEAGALYADNWRLDEQKSQRINVGGAFLDAELDLHSITTQSDWAIEPRIHSTLFPGHSDQQSTDGFLSLVGNWRTQRQAVGGVAQYANRNVVYSELLPATAPGTQLGQTQSGGGGRVTFNNRQQLERLAPTYTFEWTQRRRLHLDLDVDRVTYDRKNQFEQIGFKNLLGVGGMEWILNPRSSLTLHLTGSRFMPNRGGSDTTTYGTDGQWAWARSQVTRFYFRLGVNRSSARLNGRSIDSTGVVGGAGVQWSFQVTQILVDALRSLEPSAFGVVMTQNELRLRVNRAFQPRLKGYVALRGIDLSGSQARINVQNRDYVAAETGLEWQMTRSLRLLGSYVYDWQHFQGEPKATRNAVNVSLVYEPLSLFPQLVPGALP